MPTPPDQFQRRIYVRLPFTDEYLREDGERIPESLSRALARPWLTVRISESVVKSTVPGRNGSWSRTFSPASTTPATDEPAKREEEDRSQGLTGKGPARESLCEES